MVCSMRFRARTLLLRRHRCRKTVKNAARLGFQHRQLPYERDWIVAVGGGALGLPLDHGLRSAGHWDVALRRNRGKDEYRVLVVVVQREHKTFLFFYLLGDPGDRLRNLPHEAAV